MNRENLLYEYSCPNCGRNEEPVVCLKCLQEKCQICRDQPWLDKPDSEGWWWFYDDNKLNMCHVSFDAEEGEFMAYDEVLLDNFIGAKWQRAIVPELSKE